MIFLRLFVRLRGQINLLLFRTLVCKTPDFHSSNSARPRGSWQVPPAPTCQFSEHCYLLLNWYCHHFLNSLVRGTRPHLYYIILHHQNFTKTCALDCKAIYGLIIPQYQMFEWFGHLFITWKLLAQELESYFDVCVWIALCSWNLCFKLVPVVWCARMSTTTSPVLRVSFSIAWNSE